MAMTYANHTLFVKFTKYGSVLNIRVGYSESGVAPSLTANCRNLCTIEKMNEVFSFNFDMANLAHDVRGALLGNASLVVNGTTIFNNSVQLLATDTAFQKDLYYFSAGKTLNDLLTAFGGADVSRSCRIGLTFRKPITYTVGSSTGYSFDYIHSGMAKTFNASMRNESAATLGSIVESSTVLHSISVVSTDNFNGLENFIPESLKSYLNSIFDSCDNIAGTLQDLIYIIGVPQDFGQSPTATLSGIVDGLSEYNSTNASAFWAALFRQLDLLNPMDPGFEEPETSLRGETNFIRTKTASLESKLGVVGDAAGSNTAFGKIAELKSRVDLLGAASDGAGTSSVFGKLAAVKADALNAKAAAQAAQTELVTNIKPQTDKIDNIVASSDNINSAVISVRRNVVSQETLLDKIRAILARRNQ